jgi:hypothetical protein
VYRNVKVFHHLNELNSLGLQPQSLIRLHRWGFRQGCPFDEVHFYISSLILSAEDFHDFERLFSFFNE